MTAWWPRSRELARKHLWGIVAGVSVVVLVQFGWLDALEYLSLSKLFEWRGPRDPTLPVVIVTIDENTFAEMDEQWPFARVRHAELLTRIAAGKPLLIGMDVIFESPSSRGPKDDEALAAAVALAGNVVLGAAYVKDNQPGVKREIWVSPLPAIRE